MFGIVFRMSLRVRRGSTMTTRKILYLCGLVAAMTGCVSTYSEVKNQNPDYRYRGSSGTADVLSSCVLEILIENGEPSNFLHRNFDPRRGKWFVSSNFPDTDLSIYVLSFEDSPNGPVVELRSMKSVWGGLMFDYEDNLAMYIEECIGVQKS